MTAGLEPPQHYAQSPGYFATTKSAVASTYASQETGAMDCDDEL
eukprot:CAMPEP_0172635424 /NCGR_PEP_ID=MMETSP1068-20121228/199289_1 /TAXON_ID=35684 /ORGANISM="Pseudopedinella elastica, Strain CCMP716" /LENGTH=43 /DNA_ID= /DNA_START= /DNA_END= /DNA_ORIENTATION=